MQSSDTRPSVSTREAQGRHTWRGGCYVGSTSFKSKVEQVKRVILAMYATYMKVGDDKGTRRISILEGQVRVGKNEASRMLVAFDVVRMKPLFL